VQQLLDDKMLRGLLLDELHELLSFLRSRLLDMANTQNSAFVASASEVIQDISAAKVQAWLQVYTLPRRSQCNEMKCFPTCLCGTSDCRACSWCGTGGAECGGPADR
jgi:hypothetical protein